MSTEQTGHEQPTVPIRRPAGSRDVEPTQTVETVGGTGGDRPAAGADAPATTPLPTSGPPTAPLPTPGPAPTAPLPTSGATPTRPLGGAAAEPPRGPVPGAPTAGAGAAGAGTAGAGTVGATPVGSGATGSTTSTAPSAAPSAATPGAAHAAMSAAAPAATSAATSAATPAATPARAGTTTLPAAPDETPGTGDPGGDTGDAPPVSRTLRVGTVVWGLVVAIIGAGLVAVAAGARFDPELVLIGLLALAGAGLVAGSVAVNLRRRR